MEDVSSIIYNGKLMEINVKTFTPDQLSCFLKNSNIEHKMLQDYENKNLHVIKNDKFTPELKPQRTYAIIEDDNSKLDKYDSYDKICKNKSNYSQQPLNSSNEFERSESDPLPPANDPQSTEKFFYGKQKNSGEYSYIQQLQKNLELLHQPISHPKTPRKDETYQSQALTLHDNTVYLKSGKIFFENITNGCVAIEKIVLLSASAYDVKLSERCSLRVTIHNAVRVLGKSYNEATNIVEQVKFRYSEIPTHIRRGLEAFSAQENTHQYMQTLQNSVNSCIKITEEKINLFEFPRLEFIKLEQSTKDAQNEEKNKNESERKIQSDRQAEMNKIENNIIRNKDEIKSLDYAIQKIDKNIEAIAEKKKEKKSGWFGSNKAEDQNDELWKKDLLKQLSDARRQIHELQTEIDVLEIRKIDVKHKIKNAQIEPSTNWEKVVDSVGKVISEIEKIEQTWKSLVTFIKSVESEVSELKSIASEGNVDNSRIINAALRVSLNSWVICQCCGIYEEIIKSHVIPLVSGVSSNFGIRIEQAKDKLSSEKTKAQEIKNEVEKLAYEKLEEAVKNLPKVSIETEKVLPEKGLIDEINELEERSDFLLRKIQTVERECKETKIEMIETIKRLDEAKNIADEAIQERERRRATYFVFIVKLIISTLFGEMSLKYLLSFINNKMAEIEMLERETTLLEKNYNSRKDKNQLELDKFDLTCRQRNTEIQLKITKEKFEKAKKLRKNTIEVEMKIIKWTIMLQRSNTFVKPHI